MTDYLSSYSAGWRVRKMNVDTWLPEDEVSGIQKVSIKHDSADDAPLMQSGDMETSGLIEEGYYRIEMLPDGGGLENIATLLFTPDGSEFDYEAWGGSATGVSVLAGASDTKFRQGAYASKGSDAAAYCASLLRSCIPAPVIIEDTFTLGDHVVHDLGSSYLDGIWDVLDAGGLCMQIDGSGTVSIKRIPDEPDLIISAQNEKLLMPTIKQKLPLDDAPNVVIVYDDDQEAIAINDDPTSPTSIQARGRRIEEVEDSPTRKEGETLQQYADRKLQEDSEIYETYDIEREFWPGVFPYSLVRSNLPRTGITGDFRVMSQTLECSASIKVGETWGKKHDLAL